MTVGERIRKARKQLGLTMKQFAEPLGLAESTISKIENGTANASTAVLKLMGSVYNLDYFWLTEGSGEMFINDTDAIIEELSRQKGWNPEIETTLKEMFALPENKFNLVMELIRAMKKENEKDN